MIMATQRIPVPASKAAAPVTEIKPKRRGRAPGTPVVKRDLSGLDLGMLAAPTVVATVQERARLAPTKARSDHQIAVDKVVREAHEAWVTAGKPAKWADMPIRTYQVPPERAEDIKYLVSRGAAMNGVKVRFGNAGRTADGLQIVSFAAIDRPAGEPADKTDESDGE